MDTHPHTARRQHVVSMLETWNGLGDFARGVAFEVLTTGAEVEDTYDRHAAPENKSAYRRPRTRPGLVRRIVEFVDVVDNT